MKIWHRHSWSISGAFLLLSLGLVGWIFIEFSNPTLLSASDEKAPPSVEELKKAIEEREAKIQEREVALTHKEEDVGGRERILKDQVARYQKNVDELKQKILMLEKAVQDRDNAFQVVYEKMESKKAAAVFEKLEPTNALLILSKLSAVKSAEILGLMPSEKAKILIELQMEKQKKDLALLSPKKNEVTK